MKLKKRFPARQGWRRLLRPHSGDGVLAVDGVSLAVRAGEIFGLLGPNGAGKSTLVRLLCTLVLPTSGSARIGGHDLSDETAVKTQVGLAAGEERSFYWRLSGRENLRFYGALQGLPPDWIERRITELDEALDLDEILDRRYDRLSTGMRRRMDLARALLHKPAVLFLDEPTRSLDPGATQRLHRQIRQVAEAGHTIFLVTHRLDEAESLCDRVAIMHQGRLRAVAPVEALRQAIDPRRHYRLIISTPEGPEYPWANWSWPTQVQSAPQPEQTVLQVDMPTDTPLDTLLRPLLAAGGRILDLSSRDISLEKIFDRFTTEQSPPNKPSPWPLTVADGTAELAEPPSEAVEPAPATVNPASPPRLSPGLATLHKAIAFLRRDLQIQLSYRLSTLLNVLGILMSVASFYFVAQVFGQAASSLLSEYGNDYFAFVLIGIAFSSYQSVGLYSFSQVIQSGQSQGTLESMLTTPTRLQTILLASALWNFFQASLRVVGYLLLGGIFFQAPLGQANLGTALLVLLLSIIAFSGLGILSASFVLVAKRGNPINFVFGSLSSLLSGVYYPVAVLPSWLQPISALLPMTHTLRAIRLAMLQGAGLAQIIPEIAMLGLFTLIVLPTGLFAFRWALRRARIEGSLTQF